MKDKSLRILLAGVTVAAFTAASVAPLMAESDRGRGKDMSHGMGIEFSALDANGDGLLSAEEFAAARSTWLADRDSNGDGMLSQEELSAVLAERIMQIAEERAGMMLQRLDMNDDGMIGLDELGSGRDPAKAFSRLDRDDDGMVSQDEFGRAWSRDGKMQKHGKRGGDRDDRRGHDRDDDRRGHDRDGDRDGDHDDDRGSRDN